MDNTTKIYENFSEELKGFIFSRVRNKMLVDDILQEVFIKIHSSIDTLLDETKLRAWLYQITRNTIIDFHRQEKPTSDDFPAVDFFDVAYADVDELKELIDEVSSYTNLFLIGSTGISHNSAKLNEMCQYLYEKDLHFIVY